MEEINNKNIFKKKLHIDKKILNKLINDKLEEGIEEKLFSLFKYYDDFFTNKTLFLENKINFIQEVLSKIKILDYEKKIILLNNINLCIDKKIQLIEDKKNSIKEKIKSISKKLSIIYLSQKEIREKYFTLKNVEIIRFSEIFKKNKNILEESKQKLNNLENYCRNLQLIKKKFNHHYLTENNINSLCLFTKSFLELFYLVDLSIKNFIK